MSIAAATTLNPAQLDQLSVDAIRFLSVYAMQKANSGHPGLPLGAAPMAYVLWRRFLQHNPANPQWFNRDRFVLSAGHGSMLLYSLLHLSGYDLPLDQIKQFRQWGSITPGHPERGLTPGVETTTGPLGQGFGNGVGMAIAEACLAAHYNRPGFEIINHLNYGLVKLDLMKLQPPSEHPHGLSDMDFDELFTKDKPVIFAFHAYPWLIHRLTNRRTNHDNFHVRGYKEEGTITTPFDMTVLNDLDRLHLVMDTIDRLPQTSDQGITLKQQLKDKLVEHKQYIGKYGEDLPDIRNWKWKG